MTFLQNLLKSQSGAAVLAIWIGIALISTFANSYWISVAVTLVMWIYLATAWNIVGGLLGQVSFGNAAFFGIGAYTSVYLATTYGISPWFGMFIGAALAACAALVVGYLPFRRGLSPLVFALLTLAFSYMMLFGVSGIEALGGTNGLFSLAVGRSFWDFRFSEPATLLVIIGVFVSVLLLVIQALYNGRYGFYWRAIHDNEAAAAAMGIDVFRVKQLTFAMSAFLTAFAGTFVVQNVGFVDPPSVFGIDITVFILLFAVVGGAGSLLGPVLGAVLLLPTGEYLRVKLTEAGAASANHLIYGVALMAAILLWPGGLVSALGRFGLSRGRLLVPRLVAGTDDEVGVQKNGKGSNEDILHVQGVTKRFGGLLALHDISFSVKEGEIVGIIGPNGAGKTTLFSCLAGSLHPTEGRISYRGRDIHALRPDQTCHLGIARTFQLTQAFPTLTITEVVYAAALSKFSKDAAAHIASDVLRETGLWARRDILCRNLTLAEQRRLEIARALATCPDILLLDEIMAGLTPKEIEAAIQLIRSIRQRGVTVLLIEHHIRAVMALSGKIVVIDAGELISLGTPEEVVKDPKVIEAYLGEPDSEEEVLERRGMR